MTAPIGGIPHSRRSRDREEQAVVAHNESKRADTARTTSLCTLAIATVLASCSPPAEPPPPDIRPVRTVTAEEQEGADTISLTGRIAAGQEVSLAFPLSGRRVGRTVNAGDRVQPGQRVARLESVTADNAVQAARANLAAASAQQADARLEFNRQEALFSRGVAARAVFDRATKARQTADA